MTNTLTLHGKTKEQCEWVIANYALNKFYANNQSVQTWVEQSREWLDLYEEDRKFDQALESKFGQNQ